MRELFESNASNLSDLVGETVTIFTQSGGRSGSGFTGVLLSVNSCIVRLVTRFGSAPDDIFEDDRRRGCCGCGRGRRHDRFGTVIDIPVEKIVAFVHNTN